jgi:hypothetical protein
MTRTPQSSPEQAGALPGKAGSVLFMKNLNGQGPLTRLSVLIDHGERAVPGAVD